MTGWLLWLLVGTPRAVAATIGLDDAVVRAEEAGLDPQTARLVIASAERTLRTRSLAGGPDVRLSASVVAGAGAGWSTGDVPVGAEASARLSASLPVYAGGEIRGNRVVAEHDLALARAEADQTRQDLVLTIAGALLDLEAARATQRAYEAALLSEKALLGRVEALVAAGARTRADTLQQQAAVARQSAAVVTARRDVATVDLMLEELLRLDDAEFVGPEVGPPARTAERPIVQARRAALAAAEAAVEVAQAGGRPAVDLGLSTGTAWGVGDEAAALGDRADVRASLDVSVPLWDREVTRSAVVQARIDVASARLRLEAAEREVRTDVKQAEVDVQAAADGVAAAEARRVASQAAASVVEDRYNAGAALFTELLAARAELVDAEAAAAQAKVEAVRAAFALAWAQGGL